jgi:hypothetical protein
MIEAVPDLLATEYIADLGNERWRLSSELRPRRRRIGAGHELFADRVVEGR